MNKPKNEPLIYYIFEIFKEPFDLKELWDIIPVSEIIAEKIINQSIEKQDLLEWIGDAKILIYQPKDKKKFDWELAKEREKKGNYKAIAFLSRRVLL